MTHQITYTASYNRKAARFLRRHPDLIDKYQKTLLLLEQNPFHPSLRLHKLEGPLRDLHSVSINLSYRVTLYFMVSGDEIVPVDIGDHDTVY